MCETVRRTEVGRQRERRDAKQIKKLLKQAIQRRILIPEHRGQAHESDMSIRPPLRRIIKGW